MSLITHARWRLRRSRSWSYTCASGRARVGVVDARIASLTVAMPPVEPVGSRLFDELPTAAANARNQRADSDGRSHRACARRFVMTVAQRSCFMRPRHRTWCWGRSRAACDAPLLFVKSRVRPGLSASSVGLGDFSKQSQQSHSWSPSWPCRTRSRAIPVNATCAGDCGRPAVYENGGDVGRMPPPPALCSVTLSSFPKRTAGAAHAGRRLLLGD